MKWNEIEKNKNNMDAAFQSRTRRTRKWKKQRGRHHTTKIHQLETHFFLSFFFFFFLLISLISFDMYRCNCRYLWESGPNSSAWSVNPLLQLHQSHQSHQSRCHGSICVDTCTLILWSISWWRGNWISMSIWWVPFSGSSHDIQLGPMTRWLALMDQLIGTPIPRDPNLVTPHPSAPLLSSPPRRWSQRILVPDQLCGYLRSTYCCPTAWCIVSPRGQKHKEPKRRGGLWTWHRWGHLIRRHHK